MRIIVLPLLTVFLAVIAFAQQAPPPGDNGERPSYFHMSPILTVLDVDGDGSLSASEIAGAAAQLRKLDKNRDGKLKQDESGLQMAGRSGRGRGSGIGDEPPAEAPSAEELTNTLMAFDANHDGKLEKNEVPERMQGIFERGDTDRNGILTKEEITAMAEATRVQPGANRNRRDLAFNALDLDQNGEISADEIANAAASLRTLDKNGDGQITEDEITPPQPAGRGGEGAGRGPDANSGH
jgi:Ca2+-binding EF-hand superfamily protein